MRQPETSSIIRVAWHFPAESPSHTLSLAPIVMTSRTSISSLTLAFALWFTSFTSTPVEAQVDLGGKPKPVTAALLSEQSTIAPGKEFRVAVKLVHLPTYHTYGKELPPGVETGLPTKILWKLPEGWKAEDLPWPTTHLTESTAGAKVEGYAGTVHLPVKITPPANLAPESTVKLEATVKGLVCDPQSCMPITLPVSLDVKVGTTAVMDDANKAAFQEVDASTKEVPKTSGAKTSDKANASTASVPAQSTASLLLFAFVGGLILNVMPCVFPVLGIKILSVVNQAGEDKRQVVMHGLAYTLGVLVSFWALAGFIIGIKAAGGNVAWGFQLQSPGFVFFLTVFLFAFGLNMAGVYEVGSSAVGVGSDLTHKSGLGGSFFSGLLATVVATPCAAPFLAPALAYALTLSAVPSLFFFTVIGLGLAGPYLLLSFFPRLVSLLPRPGAWMESFKQAMSFLMFATVAFLLWTLAGMVDEYGLLEVLISLVLVAVACWIYGRWSLPHKPLRTRVKAVVFTLVFLIGGMALAWPQGSKAGGLKWDHWSPEAVTALRAEKKPIYIDFTARWCVTCQTNKLVYKDASLQEEFKKRGITTLKADWTNYDERITDALKKLDRAAVPVNVLYIPGKEEPVILPNLLTVENVKAALAEVK